MTLADARTTILTALSRMTALYHEPVFDEWVLFKRTPENSVILGYEGPRAESYQKKFREDIAPLCAELDQRQMAVGDFAFAQTAAGTGFDACIRLGPASYLFCNHTQKTIEEIRKNPAWLAAQKPFVELSGKFRDNPLI